MLLRFIYVVVCLVSSSFWWLSSVTLYGGITILLICSPVNEQLDYFHLWAIMNNAAISGCVEVFVWMCIFIYFTCVPWSGVPGSDGDSVFNSEELLDFSEVAS